MTKNYLLILHLAEILDFFILGFLQDSLNEEMLNKFVILLQLPKPQTMNVSVR